MQLHRRCTREFLCDFQRHNNFPVHTFHSSLALQPSTAGGATKSRKKHFRGFVKKFSAIFSMLLIVRRCYFSVQCSVEVSEVFSRAAGKTWCSSSGWSCWRKSLEHFPVKTILFESREGKKVQRKLNIFAFIKFNVKRFVAQLCYSLFRLHASNVACPPIRHLAEQHRYNKRLPPLPNPEPCSGDFTQIIFLILHRWRHTTHKQQQVRHAKKKQPQLVSTSFNTQPSSSCAW